MIAANFVILVHLGFILFVLFGAFLVLKWQKLVYVHVPAFAWGVLIEFTGWYCPLTPLEKKLRIAAGKEGYEGGFIEHYLLPIIYPEALTRDIQIAAGFGVLALNLALYAWIWFHFKKRQRRK